MTTTLVVTVAGPILGAFFGISTFFIKRSFSKTDAQLNSIAESIEIVSHQVTAMQVRIPTSYVAKEEFLRHIKDEERWQNELRLQLFEIREELISSRNR